MDNVTNFAELTMLMPIVVEAVSLSIIFLGFLIK